MDNLFDYLTLLEGTDEKPVIKHKKPLKEAFKTAKRYIYVDEEAKKKYIYTNGHLEELPEGGGGGGGKGPKIPPMPWEDPPEPPENPPEPPEPEEKRNHYYGTLIDNKTFQLEDGTLIQL